jgi:Lsr2/Protein of unknown function (DUF2637)
MADSRWWHQLSFSSILSHVGWLVVVTAALALSAWSLFWVARDYGLPVPLAILVSAAFDGAAMVCADLALKYARTNGDSGFGPRLGVLTLASMSAYLNMQHASLLHDPFAARILYAVPPLTAVTLFEFHSRYERRTALRRAGRVAESLPVFGRWSWILFPKKTLVALRSIIACRLERAVMQTRVSDNALTVSQTRALSNGTADQQTIRDWAKAKGYSVGERGPIPQIVRDEYLTAITAGETV